MLNTLRTSKENPKKYARGVQEITIKVKRNVLPLKAKNNFIQKDYTRSLNKDALKSVLMGLASPEQTWPHRENKK